MIPRFTETSLTVVHHDPQKLVVPSAPINIGGLCPAFEYDRVRFDRVEDSIERRDELIPLD